MPSVETHIVTPESQIGKYAKKFGALTGWREEVGQILLNQKLPDSETLEKIQAITNNVPGNEKNNSNKTEKLLENYVAILPKNLKRKAKILSMYLKNIITLNDMGIIIYKSGEEGTNIYDMLRYLTISSKFNVQQPRDAKKLIGLLKENGAPESAFGVGRSMRNFGKEVRWLTLNQKP